MDAALSREADKAVKLMHRYMIKMVHTNLTADPSTEKDTDNIVSGLWSYIEVLRPESRGYEATSKSHDGDNNRNLNQNEAILSEQNRIPGAPRTPF